MYIPIILGTAREGRESEKVAKFILQETVSAGLETEIIDVRDFRIEATDNSGESLKPKIYLKKFPGPTVSSSSRPNTTTAIPEN